MVLAFASTSGLHGFQRKPREEGFLGRNGSALPLSIGEHRVWIDLALELGHKRRPSCGRCVNWAMMTVLTVGAKAAAEGGDGGIHNEKALSPPTSFPAKNFAGPRRAMKGPCNSALVQIQLAVIIAHALCLVTPSRH